MSVAMTVVFFFFKQKTAYEMRISDWSSDVCSSDLRTIGARAPEVEDARRDFLARACGTADQNTAAGNGDPLQRRPDIVDGGGIAGQFLICPYPAPERLVFSPQPVGLGQIGRSHV